MFPRMVTVWVWECMFLKAKIRSQHAIFSLSLSLSFKKFFPDPLILNKGTMKGNFEMEKHASEERWGGNPRLNCTERRVWLKAQVCPAKQSLKERVWVEKQLKSTEDDLATSIAFGSVRGES